MPIGVRGYDDGALVTRREAVAREAAVNADRAVLRADAERLGVGFASGAQEHEGSRFARVDGRCDQDERLPERAHRRLHAAVRAVVAGRRNVHDHLADALLFRRIARLDGATGALSAHAAEAAHPTLAALPAFGCAAASSARFPVGGVGAAGGAGERFVAVVSAMLTRGANEREAEREEGDDRGRTEM